LYKEYAEGDKIKVVLKYDPLVSASPTEMKYLKLAGVYSCRHALTLHDNSHI
jgi:hypothetical protein